MTLANNLLKALRWLKSQTIYGQDRPKCNHRKLYRLPHDVYMCPECFRTYNARQLWFSAIDLSDKEIGKLIGMMKN